MDASRSIGLFAKAGVPILGVVENMSYLNCPHCGEPVEIFPRNDRGWTVQEDGFELLGLVPLDPNVGRKIDGNHPLLMSRVAASAAENQESEPDHTNAFSSIAGKVITKLDE